MTLVTIQEQLAEEIIALPENGRRAAGYGLTFLNRRTRSLQRIHKEFIAWCERHEYKPALIELCWRDLLDYAKLIA